MKYEAMRLQDGARLDQRKDALVLEGTIKAKAFAVMLNRERTHHAVWRGSDPTKAPADFHRLLGGHIEFGERSLQTVVREIVEELGASLLDPILLGVLENVFTYQDHPGHEIVFVYGGTLTEPELIPDAGGVFADNGVPILVEWRPLDDGEVTLPLYPDGVAVMIRAWASGSSRD